jgi:hypothetical protein
MDGTNIVLRDSFLKPPHVLSRYSAVAFAGCVLFGLCLILNSQVGCDGSWTLYAQLLSHGARLYTDLKIPQQPLFYIETTLWYYAFGNSWLASLIPQILHLLFFTAGFLLISQRSLWPPWQKAVVFTSSFMVAVAVSLYKFDDYPVIGDTIFLFCFLLLIPIVNGTITGNRAALSCVTLGLLCGLCFTTRPNYGALLSASIAVILARSSLRRPLLEISLWGFATLATILLVVLSSDDSVLAYLKYAIIGAPNMKGGGASAPRYTRGAFIRRRQNGRELSVLLCLVAVRRDVSRRARRSPSVGGASPPPFGPWARLENLDDLRARRMYDYICRDIFWHIMAWIVSYQYVGGGNNWYVRRHCLCQFVRGFNSRRIWSAASYTPAILRVNRDGSYYRGVFGGQLWPD